MTIEITWWVVPFLVMIITFIVAFTSQPDIQSRGGYIPDLINPMLGFINYLVATIVSLIAWLIWALL